MTADTHCSPHSLVSLSLQGAWMLPRQVLGKNRLFPTCSCLRRCSQHQCLDAHSGSRNGKATSTAPADQRRTAERSQPPGPPHTDPLALQIQQTVFSHGLSAVSSPSANASSSPRGVLQQPEKTGNDSTTERGQRVEGPARPQGMHRAQSTGKRGCLSPEERNTSSITYLGLEIQV